MDDTQITGPATDDIPIAQTPAGADPPNGSPSDPPGFSERGRMRRRMRFLRKARELAYRDLGGLVFDLHRFATRNDALVLAKLETIGRIDTELRALETTLDERRAVTVLREAGVAACPRCAAIHGSDDRFCPNCGLAMDLRAERPVAGPQSATAPVPSPPQPPSPMPAPAATPSPTAAHTPAPAMPATGQTAPPTAAGVPPTPATSTPATSKPDPSAPPVPTPPTSAHAPTATPAPAAPAASPAPQTAPPVPATPARPDGPEPVQGPPSDPAPPTGGDPADAEDRPRMEQPTEIVRPPIRNP